VISCEDAVRQLWGYLSEEVTPANGVQIAEHLEVCRRCCGELDFLGELRRFVATAQTRLPADVGVRMEVFLATLDGPTPQEPAGGGTDDRPDAQG
jgi:predicted anti-sigma-YlaC factor YlaD